jgi:hypothetical protein
VLVLLAAGAVLMRRRGGTSPEAEWAVTQLTMEAPGFSAQPAYPAQMQQPVATQPGYPGTVQQPVATQPAYAPPVVQPDPARDYYNGLLAQGYPHEDAVRYTQQYFAEFRG